MPTQEFTDAHDLLVKLESHWISLLLWFCGQTGESPETLVAGLDDAGIEPLNRYEQARKRPGFTPVHFLAFPNYIELAVSPANANRLAALGVPPADWKKRLNTGKGRLTEFRNMLQHAARFDLLPERERKEAVTLFDQHLQWLAAWWPAHPYREQKPEADPDPIRAAVQMLGRDPKSAFALADKLGFRAARNPINLNAPATQLAEALGNEFGGVYEVGSKTPGGATAGTAALYLAYLKEWPVRSAGRERYRRRVARALVEANSGQRFLIVLIDDRDDRTTHDRREIEIVFPRTRAGRPFGTVRAALDLDQPTRHHLELLHDLDVGRCTSLAEIARRWTEAFNVEKVTKTFYEEFQGLRNTLAEKLLVHNPDNPELNGWTLADLTAVKPTQAQREFQLNVNAFATRQLSRLLFLWFLQQKGWLGSDAVPGPRTFLVDLFRARPKGDNSYYAERLTPLFFDALGLPFGDERHIDAEALLGGAHIPYLDGGLFRADADPFERDLFGIGEDGRRTRVVTLPDDLFDPKLDNAAPPVGGARQRTILGLLRSYRFTTQESTPDDQSVDPDPELLGKVYENLYQEKERSDTGAYYTPREIVRYMCRQTLDGYLRDKTGIDQTRLDDLRREAVDWRETRVRLSNAEEARLASALDDVTVIDPAVGSGAFLVGMLQEIVLVRRGIRSAATNRETDRASDEVRGWKEHAITRGLHGVDINPAAVEICRLRLWLSLVIEADVARIRDIPPLPNLEFRVVAGDSLIDRMGETPFIESLGIAGVGIGLDFEMEQRHTELANLRTQYEAASERMRVDRVRALSAQIREKQFEIASVQLNRAIVKAKADLSGLLRLPRSTQAAKTKAANRVAALEAMHDGLKPDAAVLKPLLWKLAFPQVFNEGGFDIVVANPPYVRQERIAALDQETYKATFEEVFNGRADLCVFFFSRALQLLKHAGLFAFITSNKYMRANYGEEIRRALPERTQIMEVIDFGDLPVFSVNAYPAVVVGIKQREPDMTGSVSVANLSVPIRSQLKEEGRKANIDGVRGALDDLPTVIAAARPSGFTQALLRSRGWILEAPAYIALFDRLMNRGRPLRDTVDGRIYYGLKTGLNPAFVINQAERDELVGADTRSAELLRPFLRGRDIRRWDPEWAGLYLIAIQNSADADSANSWRSCRSEKAAQDLFAAEYPAIHERMSGFEARLRNRADQGRFWWEMRSCTYYSVLQGPKLIWPRNVPPWESRFALDDSGFYINDKSYAIPNASRDLCAYLNSPLVFFLLDCLTTKLRGGYLELKKNEVVDLIPIPEQLMKTNSTSLQDMHRTACESMGISGQDEEMLLSWYQDRAVYEATIEEDEPDDDE